MSDILEQIIGLYDSGLTYQQYIDAADLDIKDRHLYYLQAMRLNESEVNRALKIKAVKLLVFCSSYCKDCRIVLSILENLHGVNPLLQYRIADRVGNRDIMKEIDINCRIPLIIAISPSDFNLVYNEIPKSLYSTISGDLNDSQKEAIRKNYRKGLFKAEIMDELISKI